METDTNDSLFEHDEKILHALNKLSGVVLKDLYYIYHVRLCSKHDFHTEWLQSVYCVFDTINLHIAADSVTDLATLECISTFNLPKNKIYQVEQENFICQNQSQKRLWKPYIGHTCEDILALMTGRTEIFGFQFQFRDISSAIQIMSFNGLQITKTPRSRVKHEY